MKKALLNILRLEVTCPECHKINMAIVADLIASPKFDCLFCKAPVDVNYNKEVKDALDDIKDFVEYSYKPNILV